MDLEEDILGQILDATLIGHHLRDDAEYQVLKPIDELGECLVAPGAATRDEVVIRSRAHGRDIRPENAPLCFTCEQGAG